MDDLNADDDRTVWVRDYVALGVVQGDFRARSAIVVVERARHPSHDPELVTYRVRHAEEVPEDAAIRDLAAAVSGMSCQVGASLCVLDASVAGASMLRVWDRAFQDVPCALAPVRLVDRERELNAAASFALPSVTRLDLLSSIRVALDVEQGITYHRRAEVARRAVEDYTTAPPPSDGEWTPPPTWHVVVGVGLAIWALMERPPALVGSGFSRRDLEQARADGVRVRWDDRPVRDTTDLDAAEAARREAIRAAGGIVLPDRAEIQRRRERLHRAPQQQREAL